MNLPELPRILKKTEASITPRVFAWLEKNYPYSCAVEIKMKGNKPLRHQAIALRQVHAGVFSYKLPDTGRRQPFDGFMLKGAHALLIVCEGNVCEATGPGGEFFVMHI